MKRFMLALPLVALSGCILDGVPTSDQIQAQQQEQITKDAAIAVPVPAIVNYTEKRLLKELYELRDKPNYRTYTYLTTMNGGLVKICDSIGYGISASVQFSNPEKVIYPYTGGAAITLPQAEPNGLFIPTGLAATYVMCLDPATKDVKPVYIEPNIVVSPFPLVPEPPHQ